ncbi:MULTISPECIES: hypothetical protein [unclassified Streptomyces]|uniref:hypothetical protein n=1 Tax=unclassified Streptomyces TaxID=2593676 RepID=UPI00336A962C
MISAYAVAFGGFLLLGGVLTDAFGWASVFFVNVPLAGLAAGLTYVLTAPDAPRAAGRSFDIAGALTSTVAVAAVVFALVQGPESGWTSPAVLGSAATGAVLLAAFVVVERRSADPLLPLRLFANRNLSVGAVVPFLYMGTFGRSAR